MATGRIRAAEPGVGEVAEPARALARSPGPRVIPTYPTVTQRTRVKAGRSKFASPEAHRPGTFDANQPAGSW